MTAALPLESRPRSRRLFFSSIAASDEGVPATWSRARRAAASSFPARLATSRPRSTIATFDDEPRAPSPVPTMTADAGAGSRIAISDDEIHPLTLEGPSCGGFSRPAAARTGYVVLRIEPGGRAARLAPGGLPAPSRRSPGRWPSPLGFAALTGLPGPFPGPSLPCPTGAAVVDSFGTSRPRPAGAALTLTLEGQRGRRDVDTWGAAADFGLVEPSRRPPRRPKCLIGMELSTEVVDNPVRNPAPVLTLEGRPY